MFYSKHAIGLRKLGLLIVAILVAGCGRSSVDTSEVLLDDTLSYQMIVGYQPAYGNTIEAYTLRNENGNVVASMTISPFVEQDFGTWIESASYFQYTITDSSINTMSDCDISYDQYDARYVNSVLEDRVQYITHVLVRLEKMSYYLSHSSADPDLQDDWISTLDSLGCEISG